MPVLITVLAQVLALAEEVIAAQQAEIDQMTEWRQTWSDATP